MLDKSVGSPAILGPLWRLEVSRGARTRGFASLTLVRFAFIDIRELSQTEIVRINSEEYLGSVEQFYTDDNLAMSALGQ